MTYVSVSQGKEAYKDHGEVEQGAGQKTRVLITPDNWSLFINHFQKDSSDKPDQGYVKRGFMENEQSTHANGHVTGKAYGFA